MYARWKRQEYQSYWWHATWDADARVWRHPGEPRTHTVKYSAALVENRRVDGKPRQKVLAYLGVVPEGGLKRQHWCVGFWRRVNERLDQHNPSAAERLKIIEVITQRVPLPTQADYEASAKAQRAYEAVVASIYAPRS
jgi:hypothetical protein